MIYCISDIHGHFDKYRAMLEKISLKDADTLYVLGDVIDRGPDGVKILQDMMVRPNVVPILGNHEFTAAVCLSWLMEEVNGTSIEDLSEERVGALSEWIENGGGPTLRALWKLPQTQREELTDYVQEMELYARVKVGGHTFALTHAGLARFSRKKLLEEYELEDFLFARPTPETAYGPDETFILGHTPARLLWEASGETPRDEMFHGKGFIDIDCGCGHGGRLGCLCLDTMEEFYV